MNICKGSPRSGYSVTTSAHMSNTLLHESPLRWRGMTISIHLLDESRVMEPVPGKAETGMSQSQVPRSSYTYQPAEDPLLSNKRLSFRRLSPCSQDGYGPGFHSNLTCPKLLPSLKNVTVTEVLTWELLCGRKGVYSPPHSAAMYIHQQQWNRCLSAD